MKKQAENVVHAGIGSDSNVQNPRRLAIRPPTGFSDRPYREIDLVYPKRSEPLPTVLSRREFSCSMDRNVQIMRRSRKNGLQVAANTRQRVHEEIGV